MSQADRLINSTTTRFSFHQPSQHRRARDKDSRPSLQSFSVGQHVITSCIQDKGVPFAASARSFYNGHAIRRRS